MISTGGKRLQHKVFAVTSAFLTPFLNPLLTLSIGWFRLASEKRLIISLSTCLFFQLNSITVAGFLHRLSRATQGPLFLLGMRDWG